MEDKKQQKLHKFKDLKDRIKKELDKRLKDMAIGESVELVNGFVNQPINMELTSSLVVGGPTIPMIMLFGKQSGRIYYFALKAILKDEDLLV